MNIKAAYFENELWTITPNCLFLIHVGAVILTLLTTPRRLRWSSG